MERFTVRLYRESSERTSDDTVKRFLEFLAQRALPSNFSWRATRIERESSTKLRGFGWAFNGIIEFSKMGGRRSPELIYKEKHVILERLEKAGNFERWGEGRKWTIKEIPNLVETATNTKNEEVDETVSILTVGLDRILEIPTNFDEGTPIELSIRSDGTMLIRRISTDEEILDDSFVADETEALETPRIQSSYAARDRSGTYDLTSLMRMSSDPTRLNIMRILRHLERNVGDLCNELNMSQPSVSHHLSLLRTTELVEARRDGKHRYYSLTEKGLVLIDKLDSVHSH